MRGAAGLGRFVQLLVAAVSLCVLVGAAGASSSYTSVTVPVNLGFDAITSSSSGLLLSGTTTLDGDQGVSCLMASANPRSLGLSGLVEPFCDSPVLSGHSVVAVQQEARTMVASVRIARLSASGRVELGPVVVRYTQLSDTHLESVYADGSLWLYAPIVPGGGRALRISAATGEVLQDTPVLPAMDRPIIAANADGLYLAPSPETGFLGRGPQPNENGIIYHVGIDASGVQIFDASSSRVFQGYVEWMTGDGTSLWADICHRPVADPRCMITRFNGSSPHPVFETSDRDLTAFWVIGSVAQGFYSVALKAGRTSSSGDVIGIDPATGSVKVIASLPLPDYWQGYWYDGATETALSGRALYVLSPPGSQTPGVLYRVPIPGAA
jgi:hypothetical protein